MSNISFYTVPVLRDGEVVKIREMYRFVTGRKVRAGDALIDEVFEGMVDDDIKISHKKEYAKFLEAEKAKLEPVVSSDEEAGATSEDKEPKKIVETAEDESAKVLVSE